MHFSTDMPLQDQLDALKEFQITA